MTHVIIGYGPVGRHLAQALVERGEAVRVVTRSPQETQEAQEGAIHFHTADMTEDASARRAVAGASVVYNAAQVPPQHWARRLPLLFRSILSAAEQADARLVVADNLYMYGPSAVGPLRESHAHRPEGAKGRVRALLAAEALAAHQSGRLPVALARASDFFGPGVHNSALGRSVFPPLVRGKTADVLGNPDALHSYTYIKDFGETLAVLGTTETGWGRAWHVPNAPPKTTRQVIRLAAQIAGSAGHLRAMGRTLLSLAGVFSPLLREFRETLYQFEHPFVVDSTEFENQFSLPPTPLQDSLTQTVHWFQERRERVD